MRSLLFLLPALLLLLALPDTRGRYTDDFDDGEDLTEFDDNDFAEFEDVGEDSVIESENEPPPRPAPSSAPVEDDEDEATVENEDGQDEFEDADAQVSLNVAVNIITMNKVSLNIFNTPVVFFNTVL